MSFFENISNSADKGTDASKEFVSKTFEYSKLKAFQISALTLGMLLKIFVIGSLVSLGFIFLAMSLAIVLGEYFQNTALGYLSVGLIMLVISLILYFLRKSFDKKVIAKMSKTFFD
jgi:sterol desaturase/sphingolipid hydroxylase (fatty acid hydroxylase superfamily)